MKKFFREFKEFINKGNIVDLAVAVIVGGAFGKIVTSMVNDIIMPLLGAIIGRQSFSDLKIVIKQATATTTELAINYGNFLQTLIDFLIICFFMFLAIKVLMASKKTLEQATDKLAEGFQKLTKKDMDLLELIAMFNRLAFQYSMEKDDEDND